MALPRRPLHWRPRPPNDGLWARITTEIEAQVVQASNGWLAFASALLSPTVGVCWSSEEKAKQAVEEHAATVPDV